MKKKYILITGVAGLIGARMADWLIEKHPEYTIIGIDSLFGGYTESINDKVIFYKRDLSIDNIEDIFNEYDIEYVYHFAAYAAEGLSPFMRKFNWSNNVLSTASIINECIKHKIKRLVYTSSMSVYGAQNGQIFEETMTPAPEDPYAISKYACEMDIQCAGKMHGLDWCIIRPHNVYGVKQNIWDKYRNVLGIWMFQKIQGKPLTIYGDGEQTRAFSYIDDCLPCFWEAAISPKASKEIINLGGMRGVTINEACETYLKIINNEAQIDRREPRYEVKHAVPTYQKSIDLLNYQETTTLEEGLKEMWEWAKTQPIRKQYKWENYEINDKLYSYWKL